MRASLIVTLMSLLGPGSMMTVGISARHDAAAHVILQAANGPSASKSLKLMVDITRTTGAEAPTIQPLSVLDALGLKVKDGFFPVKQLGFENKIKGDLKTFTVSIKSDDILLTQISHADVFICLTNSAVVFRAAIRRNSDGNQVLAVADENVNQQFQDMV
jgi:hypothetical protein